MERKENKNALWGALFLIGAVAILVNKMGMLDILLGGMSLFQIVATVFLAGSLVKGLAKRSFGQILFSIAFIIIVNDELLHMEVFTPWPVLGAALLGTIGLHLIFPRVKSGYGRLDFRINDKKVNTVPGSGESRRNGVLTYESCFSETVQYVSEEIDRVCIENSFGSLQVYFTDAVPKDGTAEVKVENCFGSMVLYVPADWKVVLDVENAFGGTEEKGHCNPESGTVLYVRGEVSFGKLQIRYI